MDWIHCNGCFVQPREVKDKKFFLTNCGHIYCDACDNSNQDKKCGVCKSTYKTLLLTNKMKPDIQEYFTDLSTMLNKTAKILSFQNGHRMRLMAQKKATELKYKAAKKQIEKLHEVLKLYQKKIKFLEYTIAKTKGNNFPPSPASFNSPVALGQRKIDTQKMTPGSKSFSLSQMTPPCIQSTPISVGSKYSIFDTPESMEGWDRSKASPMTAGSCNLSVVNSPSEMYSRPRQHSSQLLASQRSQYFTSPLLQKRK